MDWHGNIFTVTPNDLTGGDPYSDSVKERPVMSKEALHKYIVRYPHVRVRKGGGPGRPALLNYDRLRADIKQRIAEKYGDVKKRSRSNRLQEMIEPDFKASTYFSEFLFDDGTNIKAEKQAEYSANAAILNAAGKFLAEAKGKMRSRSGSTPGIWGAISEAVNSIGAGAWPHTLPSNPLRLQDKYKNYLQHGYFHLIHKGNKNANAGKRTQAIDNLIVSLYVQRNIPFGDWVYDDYMQFLAGTKMIVDTQTGAVLDRNDFFDEGKGSYTTISKATVWNIVNDMQYVGIIDRLRNNRIDHVTQACPYDHRKGPEHSMSMISMDDRTFSRKDSDGNWLNAYVGADIMSEAILGIVFSSNSPTVELIWQCFREIYRTISNNGLMWPGELECENHNMKTIEPQLREMFQYVTFCTPGIGRSKYIENIFRRKKYGDEKRHQVGIGRYNQKGAFKTKSEKKDDDYKQPRVPVQTLIADELESVQRWNNELHPNQKRFAGKTRWQVLLENQHPDLGRPQKHKLFRHLGLKTDTSIRNNDFATVQHEKYLIDHLEAMGRMAPNNYSVQAYYLPEPDGSIEDVYLYQGNTFITRATKTERYQKSKLERTEEDERIRTERSKRNAHFYKAEKDAMAAHVTRGLEVVKVEPGLYENIVPEIVQLPLPRDANEEIDEWVEEYKGWGKAEGIKRL